MTVVQSARVSNSTLVPGRSKNPHISNHGNRQYGGLTRLVNSPKIHGVTTHRQVTEFINDVLLAVMGIVLVVVVVVVIGALVGIIPIQ